MKKILWTLQPKWIFEKILNEGVFYFNSPIYEEKTQGWDWAKSYDWLKEQMISQGIQKPELSQDLGWAWLQWTEKYPYPHGQWIKSSLKNTQDTLVRIKIELDQSRFLVSDYMFWHHVLNFGYLGNVVECEKFNDIVDKTLTQEEQYTIYENEHFSRIIKESWSKIFDLNWCNEVDSEYENKESNPLQATFWHLEASDVICAEEFSFTEKKKLLFKK